MHIRILSSLAGELQIQGWDTMKQPRHPRPGEKAQLITEFHVAGNLPDHHLLPDCFYH